MCAGLWSTNYIVLCAGRILGQKQWAQGNLRNCKNGSDSTFSDSMIDANRKDSDSVDTQADPNLFLLVSSPMSGGAGKNDHMFSGSWGAQTIIFRELESTLLFLES